MTTIVLIATVAALSQSLPAIERCGVMTDPAFIRPHGALTAELPVAGDDNQLACAESALRLGTGEDIVPPVAFAKSRLDAPSPVPAADVVNEDYVRCFPDTIHTDLCNWPHTDAAWIRGLACDIPNGLCWGVPTWDGRLHQYATSKCILPALDIYPPTVPCHPLKVIR